MALFVSCYDWYLSPNYDLILILILYSLNNGLPFSNREVQYKVHKSSRTQIVLFLSLSNNQVPQGESSNPSE